ncbi:hypothetical protein [Agromyces albus]|uniref:hypothetical protein n=1 Tax=Agromyces albus TaxID=205332 RepID=UPI00277F22B2|nr:hypothetical protein [Agromyces albus]MDQ0576844.1 hypothetical protein [Agromyces albus]
MATDPDIQVVLFDSSAPDFFYNHFDLAAAADFPCPRKRGSRAGLDRPGPETLQGPYITIATIRGRTLGGGNELAFDLRYASREKAIFGRYRRMRTSSPPTASSPTPSPCPDSSLAPQASRRLRSRPASTWNTASASTSASPISDADTIHHE